MDGCNRGLAKSMSKTRVSSAFFNGRRGRLRRFSVALSKVLCRWYRASETSRSTKARSMDSHLFFLTTSSSSVSVGCIADHCSTHDVPAVMIKWYHCETSAQLIRGVLELTSRYELDFSFEGALARAPSCIHQDEFSAKSPTRSVFASGSNAA